MKRWKLWIGILLVFFLGGAVGSLGTGYVLKEHEYRFLHNPARKTGYIVEKLTKKLDLNEDQKEQIKAIVQKTQETSHARFLLHREEMRSILNEGIAEIRKGLTPRQQEKMDQLHEEFERRRTSRENRRKEKQDIP
jgi:Spy/CpxP family protein refolding chaperone